MATRTNTELKVFLDSATDSYDKYGNLTDKSGTVFFDRNRRAVYAEGVLITSDVIDVKVEGGILKVKYVGQTSYTDLANLAIPDEFVRFNKAQSLSPTQKQTARTNIGVEDAVNNLTSDSTTAPLSAAQGKELKRQIDEKVTAETGKGLSTNDYTDAEKNKLASIAEGAQVNKISSFKANNTEVGGTGNGVTVSLSGNLVDSSLAASGNVGFNLSHKYVPSENKIYFFNSATAPTTGTEGYIFAIDTSDFVQAGMINNVVYNSVSGELEITFPTVQTDGTLKDTTVKVDLSKLVDVYKSGDGLTATVGTDGTTFAVVLGGGLAFDNTKAITLSLGNGLFIDTSDKLVVDFESNGVTSINGMGGGAYTINAEGVAVGTAGNALRPIEVVNDSAAKKLKITARPADMLAQFFHENKNNENATSGIRAKGVRIEEAENGNPYSMLMDFTPKVWSF